MSRKSNKKPNISLEKNLNLKKDFPPQIFDDWMKSVINDLRGRSSADELFTDTYEGIKLRPIYTQEDLRNIGQINSVPGFWNYLRGTNAAGYSKKTWDICQEIPAFSASEFNINLAEVLQRGQTAISLVPDLAFQLGIDPEKSCLNEIGQGGISISHLRDFMDALSGIDLLNQNIHIKAGFSSLIMIMMLTAYSRTKKINAQTISGSIEGDPLGFLIMHGKLPIPVPVAFDHMEWGIRWAKTHFPQIKTVGVNTFTYDHSGASAVQELAFAMATAVEYVNQLQDRNLPIDDIASQIRFSFGIGPFFFMEIAKLRAAKILWSKIVSEFGGGNEAQKINIHARTSTYNQSVYDPYVNMLRVTTEALAAIIGGIDSLHTGAFDEAFTLPDEFSRRIARNTQLILEKEAQLVTPVDPAGGSYYVETLTVEMAQNAWGLFQDIEKLGGMLQSIQNGFPQKKVSGVAAKKNRDLEVQKTVMVGTNMYANVEEKSSHFSAFSGGKAKADRIKQVATFKQSRNNQSHANGLRELTLALQGNKTEIVQTGTEALLNGATVGEIARLLKMGKKESVHIKKLSVHRLTEIFETIRSAVEHYSKKRGSRPKIFLALWGDTHRYQNRAEFSRNFFEVAGCDVADSSGSDKITAIIQSALAFKAQIIVFCSSDDQYPELVAGIMGKLKKKNPEIIFVLTGFPQQKNLGAGMAKIDAFIYQGIDQPRVLSGLLKKIGVEQP